MLVISLVNSTFSLTTVSYHYLPLYRQVFRYKLRHKNEDCIQEDSKPVADHDVAMVTKDDDQEERESVFSVGTTGTTCTSVVGRHFTQIFSFLI